MSDLWRTGRKVGRTIYYDDNLSGVMDTGALAKRAVDALNGAADIERITRELNEALAEVERLREALDHAREVLLFGNDPADARECRAIDIIEEAIGPGGAK